MANTRASVHTHQCSNRDDAAQTENGDESEGAGQRQEHLPPRPHLSSGSDESLDSAHSSSVHDRASARIKLYN